MSTEQSEDKLEPDNVEAVKQKKKDKSGKRIKPAAAEQSTGRNSADSYVRTLMFLGSLFVIGALLTAIFAYFNGLISFDQDRATTIDEFTVARSRVYADVERTAGALSQLAIAQIGNGRFAEAEGTIQEAYALNSPDEERNQGPLFAHAILAEAQGQSDLAIERYEEAMSRLREDFDRVFESDMEPNWAQAFGMHPNYYEAAVALSFLYRDRGEYDKQIEMLNIAAEGMPTSADIFLFRGNAKLAQGDNNGAIEDFSEVLRFIPDDAEAKAGIEEAGGTVNDGEE